MWHRSFTAAKDKTKTIAKRAVAATLGVADCEGQAPDASVDAKGGKGAGGKGRGRKRKGETAPPPPATAADTTAAATGTMAAAAEGFIPAADPAGTAPKSALDAERARTRDLEQRLALIEKQLALADERRKAAALEQKLQASADRLEAIRRFEV